MDKYILGQSNTGNVTKDTPEVTLNIQLEKNTYFNNSLIYGYVTDLCGKPIENATINFINENNKNLGSVCSSKEGLYTFFKVKYNSKVKIVVKKKGYKTNFSSFLIICLKKFNYNVLLKELPISAKALISGHILDKDNIPLEGIIIYLLKNSCNNYTIFKSTISNKYGQFVFQNIPKEKYLIIINNSNFKTYNKQIKLLETDNIFNIDIKLIKKDLYTRITGQITDDTGEVIPNAIVVLYKITESQELISIKYTLCDEEGKYIFTNIPFGNYIVKAK